MQFNWSSLGAWSSIRNVVDIVIVWYLLYNLLLIVKGTRAVQLMKGLAVIAGVKFISYMFGLITLDWIMNLVIKWGVVGAIVVFQPEIRRGLEHIGRSNFFSRKSSGTNQAQRMIEELNISVQYMAKRRIGALICIEQSNSLEEYINTGIALQSRISNQLMTQIFIPNTPLHDGAVIIRGHEVEAAACYLPLSESKFIPKELGTRHRAAIGLSEVTDALIIVISEETGKVSVALREKLLRELTPDEFVEVLSDHLITKETSQKVSTILTMIIDFFRGGRMND